MPDNRTDSIQAFMLELDQLCERHGLWLDTGGLDDLVRVTPRRLGRYFVRRIDVGDPILCSLPVEGPLNLLEGWEPLDGKDAMPDLDETHEDRFVSAEEVDPWLVSWGTDNKLPAPEVRKNEDPD